MNRCPIETIALLAQPLPHDVNGNPRHFISVVDIPVTPGSKLARKVGLRMFRGKSRGPGFVIQSHHLETSLREVFAALDQHAPQGAPHAVRSDGPLFFVLRLPDEQYRYLTETFEALAPHLIETTEIFGKIIIPSGLPSPDCDAAVNMLMSFPVLRTATLKQLFHQWVPQPSRVRPGLRGWSECGRCHGLSAIDAKSSKRVRSPIPSSAHCAPRPTSSP